MPQNLVIIVLVQSVIFGVIQLLPQTHSISLKQWGKIAIVGLVYGVSMDILLGMAGIFAYLPAGPESTAVEAINLPVFLLILNAFVSYGLAVATTALIADFVVGKNIASKFSNYVIATVFVIGAMGIFFSARTSFFMMMSCGAVLVASGELLLTYTKKCGPLVLLLSEKSALPFLKLWAFSVVIGASYEIVNFFFPFWMWLPSAEIPESRIRILVIVFGYFALFHSITVIWHLIDPGKQKYSSK